MLACFFQYTLAIRKHLSKYIYFFLPMLVAVASWNNIHLCIFHSIHPMSLSCSRSFLSFLMRHLCLVCITRQWCAPAITSTQNVIVWVLGLAELLAWFFSTNLSFQYDDYMQCYVNSFSVDFNMMVLSSNAWPFQAQAPFSVPPEVCHKDSVNLNSLFVDVHISLGV